MLLGIKTLQGYTRLPPAHCVPFWYSNVWKDMAGVLL